MHSSLITVSLSASATIMARRSPGTSWSLFPAPMPTLSMVNTEGGSRVLAAAAKAAPVGVTYSPLRSAMDILSPESLTMLTTAGTGTGSTPCWHLTVPVPSTRGEKQTWSTSRSSRQNARDAISTIESFAPTSWKCTCSTGTPWASDSAFATTSRMRCAIAFAFSVRDDASMIAAMSAGERCSWWRWCPWCSSSGAPPYR